MYHPMFPLVSIDASICDVQEYLMQRSVPANIKHIVSIQGNTWEITNEYLIFLEVCRHVHTITINITTYLIKDQTDES